MKATIKKGSEAIEFETKERCSVVEIANDSDDELVSIAQVRVRTGVVTAWHQLIGTTERYIIVSGKGKMEIGNFEPVVVCKGDVVRIPKDTPQRIANIGATDLIFYAVCSPRFKSNNYMHLE